MLPSPSPLGIMVVSEVPYLSERVVRLVMADRLPGSSVPLVNLAFIVLIVVTSPPVHVMYCQAGVPQGLGLLPLMLQEESSPGLPMSDLTCA